MPAYNAEASERPIAHDIFRYQNSYRLESGQSFKVDKVQKILKEIMNEYFENAVYDTKHASKLCLEASSEIKSSIKELKFDRYKIIVAVTILEKLDQGVQSSWGFLWDHERDNYAYHIKETPTFTALATVVGLYYE